MLSKLLALFGKASPQPAVTPQATPPSADGHVERRKRARVNPRRGTRVLIVDDSPTIVKALGKMLHSAGCTILEAGDAESALERVRDERPDLIFLDIVLPGMDGFAALRQLRRDPATRDIPVIMISGNARASEHFFGSRIAADDFMKKPFARQELFARVERLLDDEQVPRRPPESAAVLTPADAAPVPSADSNRGD